MSDSLSIELNPELTPSTAPSHISLKIQPANLSELPSSLVQKAAIYQEDSTCLMRPGQVLLVPKPGLVLENNSAAGPENAEAFSLVGDVRHIKSVEICVPRKSFTSTIELRLERKTPQKFPRGETVVFNTDSGSAKFEASNVLNKHGFWLAWGIPGVYAETDDGCLSSHVWFQASIQDQRYRPPLKTLIQRHLQNVLCRETLGGTVGVAGLVWTLVCFLLFGNDPRLFFMALGLLTSGVGFAASRKSDGAQLFLSAAGLVTSIPLVVLGTSLLVEPGEVGLVYRPGSYEIVQKAAGPGSGTETTLLGHSPLNHANSYRTRWDLKCPINPSGSLEQGKGTIELSVRYELEGSGTLLAKNFSRGLTQSNQAGQEFQSEVCAAVSGQFQGGKVLAKRELRTELSRVLAQHANARKQGLTLAASGVQLQQLTIQYE